MPDRCPIIGGLIPESEIPDYCFEHCGDRWETAIEQDSYVGEYAEYPLALRSDCDHPGETFSHNKLTTIVNHPEHNRVFTIVDECTACAEDLGEQEYGFTCSNDASPTPYQER